MIPRFTPTVGVVPGTTTMQLGFAGTNVRVWDPYAGDFYRLRGLRAPTEAKIRWDIILGVGGGALVISLLTGLLASSIGK